MGIVVTIAGITAQKDGSLILIQIGILLNMGLQLRIQLFLIIIVVVSILAQDIVEAGLVGGLLMRHQLQKCIGQKINQA